MLFFLHLLELLLSIQMLLLHLEQLVILGLHLLLLPADLQQRLHLEYKMIKVRKDKKIQCKNEGEGLK